MLTGDHAATAQAIAAQVGIEHVLAEVLPAEKAAKVRAAAGSRVTSSRWSATASTTPPHCPAADVGIAIGTGADVAIAASDITLVGGDLRGIVSAIALSRRTVTTMKQGLGWAFGYNLLLIPVAAGALYGGTACCSTRCWPRRDGDELGQRGHQRAAAAPLPPAGHRARDPAPAAARPARPVRLSHRRSPAVALALGIGLTAGTPDGLRPARHERPARLDRSHRHADAPTMSMMMTTDDPARRRRRRRRATCSIERARRHPPRVSRPGSSSPSTDARTGRPVERPHPDPQRVDAPDRDARRSRHVHPRAPRTHRQPGQLAVQMTFPTPGRYIINTEFRRNGQMADMHDRQLVTIPGPAPARQPVTPGPRTMTVDGVRVELRRATPRPARPAT